MNNSPSLFVISKAFHGFIFQALKVSDHYPVEVQLKSVTQVDGKLHVRRKSLLLLAPKRRPYH